jgi:predicted Zn-dependent protease
MMRTSLALATVLATAVVANVALVSSVQPTWAAEPTRPTFTDRDRAQFVYNMGGLYRAAVVRGYVSAIGTRLSQNIGASSDDAAPRYVFDFEVLDHPRVGAYVLPGGHVYVTRGLLAVANSEDEVAAAIAHEMAHIIARHADHKRAQAQALRSADALNAFNREQEIEADFLSLSLLARAGYDPTGQIRMLQHVAADMQFIDLLEQAQGHRPLPPAQSHPLVSERIARVEAALNHDPPVVSAARRRDRHLEVIDGMAYGDAPKYGMARGRSYFDSSWRYTFTAPPGFALYPGVNSVSARGPDGAVIQIDRRTTRRRTDIDMETYLRRYASQGVQLRDVEQLTIDGMDAAIGRGDIRTRSGLADIQVVTIRFSPRTVFRLRLISPVGKAEAFKDALRGAVGTFRRLSPQEAASIKPFHVRVIDVAPGTNVADIAAMMSFVDYPVERLLVLNGQMLDTSHLPSPRVKIVTE